MPVSGSVLASANSFRDSGGGQDQGRQACEPASTALNYVATLGSVKTPNTHFN